MSESITSELGNESKKCIVKVDGRHCKNPRACDVAGRRLEDFEPQFLARMCTKHGNRLSNGETFEFMVDLEPVLFPKAYQETTPNEDQPGPAYLKDDQSMDLNPRSPIANLGQTNLTTNWHNDDNGGDQEYQPGTLAQKFLESNDRMVGAYETLQAKLETVAESQQQSEKRMIDNLQVVLDTLDDLNNAITAISQKKPEPDQRAAINFHDVVKIQQEISDQMKKGFAAINTQVQKTIQQQATSEAVQHRSEMSRLVEQVKKVELTVQTQGLAEAEASKSRSKGRQQLVEQLHRQVREFPGICFIGSVSNLSQSQLIDSKTSDFVDECLSGR
ncbi:MAG: hypothetical protein Q9221_000355 [Calogaya cf. arnoldii]